MFVSHFAAKVTFCFNAAVGVFQLQHPARVAGLAAMENEPNHSSEPAPSPFPTRLFWCVGLLPVVSAIGCVLFQSGELAFATLLLILPSSIAAGGIYGWHHREKGIASLGFALLVFLALAIFNTAAAFAGCTAAGSFRNY